MSPPSTPSAKDSPTRHTKARVDAEPPERCDVVIVGCGVAGLMAGAELSQGGLRVALFDPHYVAGGCTTQFARSQGGQHYRFDVGLHYIGDCGRDGTIPRLLRGVGIEQTFVPLDPDGFDTLVFPDFRFRIPADQDLYRQRLLDLFPSEKRGIDRYLRLVREVGHIGRRMENDGGELSARTLLEIAARGRLLAMSQSDTMASFLDSCTKDPKLRAVLVGQNGDYGLPPSEVAAVMNAGLAAHYFHGAYYPKGGGQILSDKLASCIERNGGSIHLRCGIEQILVERGRAVGVRTEARKELQHTVRAERVVSAADLKRTLLELLPAESLPRRWRKRAEGYNMAAALFMTYLGVRGDMTARGLGAGNVWQYDDYDIERQYQQARRSDEITPHCSYITSASLKDPETDGHAPEGVTNLEVMTVVDGEPRKWGVPPEHIEPWRYKRNEAYLAIKQAVEDNLIERVEALFPGTRDDIVFQESATPITHSRYTRASGGTGYGLAASPEQFMDNRPGYEGPIDRMFLCGASTRAGHGIVGAMLSGHYCARLVLAQVTKR